MKQCKSITRNGTRCAKHTLLFSKYCWVHQDLINLSGLVLSILLFGFGLYFDNIRNPMPNLITSFEFSDDHNPAQLWCKIVNTTKYESKDVYLSFSGVLPLGTNVYSESGHEIELIESKKPFLQTEYEDGDQILSFAIYIPRIAGKDTTRFLIKTINSDNLRAANQKLFVRKEIVKVISAFYTRLNNQYSSEMNGISVDDIIRIRMIDENFFRPYTLHYEKGRFPISIFTVFDKSISDRNRLLYKKHKKEFIDVFQNRRGFKAPVLKIKSENGFKTYAEFPPYVSTYIEKEGYIDEKGHFISDQNEPKIPLNYDFE